MRSTFGAYAILIAAAAGSPRLQQFVMKTNGTMRAVRKTGILGCKAPDFGCVTVDNATDAPTPGFGEVLIKVASSGINPDEISILALPAVHYTLGIDVAGEVVALGPGCSERIRVGDRVFATGIAGGMAEYAVRPEFLCGRLADSVDLTAAGTLPTVAMTSYGALHSAGAPWTQPNMTVLVTAGAGGTGYTAIQLAKALGAARVVTAASADHLPFLRSLLGPADLVVDYHTTDVFDAVPDRSVHVVLSNHKSNSSAARAMSKLTSPGGVYVTLDGDTTTHVPHGVRQVAYDLFDPSEAVQATKYIEAVASHLADGSLRAAVEQTFGFADIRDALELMARGHVASKLAVVP